MPTLVRHKFISERTEGVAGAIGKPPPRLRRGEIRVRRRIPSRLLPQKELSCVKRMTEATPPTPHVRGGSVRRRGLNQAAGTRASLAWGRKFGGKVKLIPSCSSGGSAREGLLSEKPPPSHTPTSVPLFGRGGLGERRFS